MNIDDYENGSHTRTMLGALPPSEALANADDDVFPSVDDSPLVPSAAVGDGVSAGKDPANGRFLPGNAYAKGNPLARKAQQLRTAMYRAVGTADLAAVIKAQVDKAKRGDSVAAKVILQTLLGPPVNLDVVEQVARLENIYLKGKTAR